MDLNNCYINCLESEDPAILLKIQLILFSKGYTWGGTSYSDVNVKRGPFLYIKDNQIFFNRKHTSKLPYKNFTLISIKDILEM